MSEVLFGHTSSDTEVRFCSFEAALVECGQAGMQIAVIQPKDGPRFAHGAHCRLSKMIGIGKLPDSEFADDQLAREDRSGQRIVRGRLRQTLLQPDDVLGRNCCVFIDED